MTTYQSDICDEGQNNFENLESPWYHWHSYNSIPEMEFQ